MKKQLRVLAAPTDREALAPILEALEARGLRPTVTDEPGKNDLILAVLSENLYADEALTKRVLDLVAAGAENVLPLRLDDTKVPEALMNALYARNIIPAGERDAALLAERIVAALPKTKSRLPLCLTLGAAVLAVLAWVLIVRSPPKEPEAVPVMANVPAELVLPEGLTGEDLARVVDMIIIGDRMEWYTQDELPPSGIVTSGNAVRIVEMPDYDQFAYRSGEEGGHWYSKEDGHEFLPTRYEDLRFLEYMPNLRSLTVALAESEQLPRLSALESLESLALMDNRIPDLEWTAGSSVKSLYLVNSTGALSDFSPLTSCERLKNVQIDLTGTTRAELGGFAPPALELLWIDNGQQLRGELELSGLASCGELRDLELKGVPVRDLSFLRGTGKLEALQINDCPQVQDISPVDSLKALKYLYIGYCPRITDYTAIAGCAALESVHFQCDYNGDAMRDASFLRDLPRLRDIGLYSCNLRDMDFLEGIADNGASVSLGFAGSIQDYSGLAYVKHYSYLHVNPRGQNGSRGGDFSAVQPYIRDARVDDLMLYTCSGVDLGALPDGIRNLSIRYGDLTDLHGLKAYDLWRLELYDCQYLTSLDGIENVPTLSGNRGQMELSVWGCPRLTDWSALEGAYLETLKLQDTYTVPDLHGSLLVNNLYIDSVEGLDDLRCLENLIGGNGCNLSLVGLDRLYDLTPLRSFSGNRLTVPPQVADQARELVDAGNYDQFDVAYPDGSWQPFNGSVELMSLDELSTLPKSFLQKIERLCVVGDTLVEIDGADIQDRWEDGSDTPTLVLRRWDTGEEEPLEYGEGTFTDLTALAGLTGLRELRLYAQPLESLDGIQNLASLEILQLSDCPALTDVSAAFAVPTLRYLTVQRCPAESIQGVQNLSSLVELNINGTAVTDLSPLCETDFSAAMDEGGFRLYLSGAPIGDYSPLASIPALDNLDINDVDAALFVPYLEDTPVRRLCACNAFTRRTADANALFADFVRAHPGLEELWIPGNEGITDLTPVLELEGLDRLRVSRNMEKAIDSLEGREFGFEFEIES